MDSPDLPEREHIAALAGLARINRSTGVAAAIYRRIRRYARELGRPIRLLDIATGSGDMPIHWARQSRRDGITIHCTGVDISPTAIAYATQAAKQSRVDVQFLQRDVLADRLPTGFDVVTCGLFIHHLSEPQIVHLLAAMRAVASHGVIVCDIERSRLNLACVWVLAHAVSRSGIVHRDAVRSVKASLTREEFCSLAQAALDCPVRVDGLPPCRFIATMDEATARVPGVVLAGVQSA